MNWDDLRYFLAIARGGSLSAAGRALNVSQPTVSRRLAAMEERFGARLFHRAAAGLELSQVGADMLDAVADIEEQVNLVDLRISGHDQRLTGLLRVTCTEVMANLYLTPLFGSFLNQHPAIDLHVISTFQHLSLSRREADVALRMVVRPPDTLIGRNLADTAVCVYAAQDYENPDGAGETLDWIGWQDDSYDRLMITPRFPGAAIRHRVDDMRTMRAMVRSGLGRAVLPCYMADIDPGLRRFSAPWRDGIPNLWILYHPQARRVARVRVFTEFIADAIHADRDLFEGRRP